MASPLGRRVVAISLLFVVLSSLCLWFGTLGPAPADGAYPGSGDVGPTLELYIGQPVELGGVVVDTAPVLIRLDYGADRSRILTVTNLDHAVANGDVPRVFGTLTDEDTVRATRAFTVPAWGFTYTYSVSALAGLWVLARLLGQWRLDPTMGLVRCTNPHQPLSRLRSWRTDTGDDDA